MSSNVIYLFFAFLIRFSNALINKQRRSTLWKHLNQQLKLSILRMKRMCLKTWITATSFKSTSTLIYFFIKIIKVFCWREMDFIWILWQEWFLRVLDIKRQAIKWTGGQNLFWLNFGCPWIFAYKQYRPSRHQAWKYFDWWGPYKVVRLWFQLFNRVRWDQRMCRNQWIYSSRIAIQTVL